MAEIEQKIEPIVKFIDSTLIFEKFFNLGLQK